MNVRYLFCFLVCGFVACDTPKPASESKPEVTKTPTVEKADETPSAEKTTTAKSDTAAVKTGASFAAKSFSKSDLPKGISVSGGIKGGMRWTDGNGENFVILSRAPAEGVKQYLDKKTDSAEVQADGTSIPYHETDVWLFATHFVQDGAGETKTMREVKQRAPCASDADLLAQFVSKANSVTDLDKDNIGEATFAYAFTCATDMSPQTYKLFMIEDGAKYVLRGTTKVEDVGGGFEPDKAFDGNDAFLSHATAVWNKTKKTY